MASNAGAIALYRKHGFIEEGRRYKEILFEDGTFDDDLSMYQFVNALAGTEPERL